MSESGPPVHSACGQPMNVVRWDVPNITQCWMFEPDLGHYVPGPIQQEACSYAYCQHCYRPLNTEETDWFVTVSLEACAGDE